MSKMLSEKKIAKNMAASVLVQAISLIIGFVLNLIVPKFISEYDYSYWQTFLLYSQYLGIFHFGFLDGFVLRYSQYDYEELDKKSVRSQYFAITVIDIFISLILFVIAFIVFDGPYRAICILIAVSTCIKITYAFMSYTFQTTNRIKTYSLFIAVQRVLYCILILSCLVFKLHNYIWYCVVYLLSDLLVMFYFGVKHDKELFMGSLLKPTELWTELKSTLSAGIWLMLSAYAANLLVGSGKMVVQWFWDQLTFGKISLAFSLSNFVLQFVTAISVVLFPSMKRMEEKKLPDMYLKIRNIISPILFFVLILYFPGSIVLKLWLPKYAESIVYLGILMPIIIYTSKVSLLTNNYLKAYRKERSLLLINVSIVAIAFLTFLIIGCFIKSIIALLIAIVVFIMLRSIISEIVVLRVIKRKISFDFLVEFIMTIVFIIGVIVLSVTYAFLLYAIFFICYAIFKRKEIKSLFQWMKKKN